MTISCFGGISRDSLMDKDDTTDNILSQLCTSHLQRRLQIYLYFFAVTHDVSKKEFYSLLTEQWVFSLKMKHKWQFCLILNVARFGIWSISFKMFSSVHSIQLKTFLLTTGYSKKHTSWIQIERLPHRHFEKLLLENLSNKL